MDPIDLQATTTPIPERQMTSGYTRRGVLCLLHCRQIWWGKTGQRFPIMRLPAELRALVYKHTLGEIIHPHTYHNQATGGLEVTLGVKLKDISNYHEHEDFAWARSDTPDYNILSLNRQTRHEALKAGCESTWKKFTTPVHSRDVLNPAVVSPPYI